MKGKVPLIIVDGRHWVRNIVRYKGKENVLDIIVKHVQLLTIMFQAPLICPILFVICSLSMVALSLYSAPVNCGIGLLMVVSAIPFYLIGVKWKNKPQWLLNAISK